MFKIGLCLSGGGAKSIVYIGLLKALEEEGIKLSVLSATSAGALIGALYSVGYSINEIEKIAVSLAEYSLTSISIFPKKSLFDNKNFLKFLEQYLNNKYFEDCKIPIFITATDLLKGEEVIFSKGELKLAVLASCSFPAIFPPVKYNDYLLVDGGVLNNTPTDILKKAKMNFIITADTYTYEEKEEYDNLLKILFRSYQLIDKMKIKFSLKKADFILKPELDEIGLTSLKEAKYIILKGYESFQRQKKEFYKKIRNSKIKYYLQFGL
ncbi:MAG TPA: patatin-like phospholipase family protein [bacterium]|nr:patatin-like phospholipase family protein [bacterium]HOL48412.1 patatin-like phospholipase family protein [bacterium]HPQ18147.1 patatin-like phospholipase family protein [bacterium]